MGAQEETKKREPYRIQMEEHAPFSAIAETVYLSSSDMLKLVNELFRSAFADYEGSIFEATNGGEPTVSLFFNHGKYDEEAVTACERLNGNASGNVLLDRYRNRDRQILEGDRYYLSQNGKDVIGPLLTYTAFNNGNPNWKMLSGDFKDSVGGTIYYNANQVPVFTKVSSISLSKLCSLIFGERINGQSYDYDVKIAAARANTPYQYGNQMGIDTSYILTITKVSREEVNKIYNQLGYQTMGTSRIVRD